MKKWILNWLGLNDRGYASLPDPLDDNEKRQVKISVLKSESGAYVVTTERYANQQWQHRVYTAEPGQTLIDLITVILVSERVS
jgi:hypothetical protein